MLVAVALAVAVLSLLTGSYALSVAQIGEILWGRSDDIGQLVVVGLRLPRIVASLCVGAGFGVAGAIFQSLCRNPLASPDIIGFTTGSATGALATIVVLGQSGLATALGSVIGGFAAAALVYLLALRRGLTGDRFILSGVALSAMLMAFNEYLVTRAELERAEAAKTWLFGSLNGVSWSQVTILAPGIVVLLLCAGLLWPGLKMLEIGDDLAVGLGLSARRSRLVLMGVGLGLAALATALAGPIHFLALAAGPLARGLVRPGDPGVVPVAIMGAVLLIVSDFLAQHLMAPFQIPVGLITGAIGGVYLVVLLTRRTGGCG
ncbi:MAG: iron chelate uptake ABC transporter family permease subunit [Azospirillaceae bacterium]|nr:iron chelate uptake ABC transporter family permease subunit [Azospirillaceae bacterium]